MSKLTIEDVVSRYGRMIEEKGWGRRKIAEFLNKTDARNQYSNYFGRQVADRIAERDSEGSEEPREGVGTSAMPEAPLRPPEEPTEDAITRERKRLGLDETWKASKVWGDGKVSFYQETDSSNMDEILEEMLDFAEGYAPDYEKLQAEKTQIDNPFGNYMAVMGLKDVHFGNLAHRDETGQDYDLKIALKRWRQAALQLLAKVQHVQAERVIIPIGSDALHVNGGGNSTMKGTSVDVDGRWWKAFDEACGAYRWLIEHTLALPSVRSVEAIAIPGNHGGEFELALARWVQAWFRQVDNMSHDLRPLDRKYVLHGQTLLGFTHGDNAKLADLPQLMAVDVPELWGASTYREFHTDHRHHRNRKLNSPGEYLEFGGVIVTINPALCGPDKWHFENGFVGNIPSAQVSIYDDYGQEWLGWAKIKT